MEEEYSTFRSFNSIEEASPVLQILKDKGIDCKAANPSNMLNSSFGGERNPYEVQVLVKRSDFTKAENALMEEARQSVSADNDHYLSAFTDAELVEIIEKPDEWSEEDYMLAQKMLEERGHTVSDETLAKLKDARMEELRAPQKADEIWIYIGYITALLGGLLGIFIGWLYMTTKKLLPDGERVYAYDESTRKQGMNMLIIGVVSLVLFVILASIRFIHTHVY